VEPILDKARAGQNALERLASAIPGFKGYRERELRRDADRQQREHLAGRLEANKKALNELADQATRGGSLDAINDIEAARKRLDRVAARLRYAERGYSVPPCGPRRARSTGSTSAWPSAKRSSAA
jgi:hypothetical protein